jgi:hypothetical protein
MPKMAEKVNTPLRASAFSIFSKRSKPLLNLGPPEFVCLSELFGNFEAKRRGTA